MKLTAELCVYCGWDANSIDHLLPRTWTGEAARKVTPTVPACMDCNVRLGDKFAPTIAERRAIVAASLRKKHRKLLQQRPWAQKDIQRLGYALRSHVEARETKRLLVAYRLENLEREDDGEIENFLDYLARF